MGGAGRGQDRGRRGLAAASRSPLPGPERWPRGGDKLQAWPPSAQPTALRPGSQEWRWPGPRVLLAQGAQVLWRPWGRGSCAPLATGPGTQEATTRWAISSRLCCCGLLGSLGHQAGLGRLLALREDSGCRRPPGIGTGGADSGWWQQQSQGKRAPPGGWARLGPQEVTIITKETFSAWREKQIIKIRRNKLEVHERRRRFRGRWHCPAAPGAPC